MIEFDALYLADLKDDFEEAGRNGQNFNLWDFINYDLSRAFAFGYSFSEIVKDRMWIPVSIRKQMRRMNEGMEKYNAQIKWLNDKYGVTGKINIQDYASFILENIFEETEGDLLKLAIILGASLNDNE